MPIYEYSCGECDDRFEVLSLGKQADQPTCPSCRSRNVRRGLSVPGVQSDGTRDLAMRAAKKRDRIQARDRMHERLRYEASHDRHG